MECYEVLYNYFHGAITGRKELLKKKVELDIELSKAENELLENPVYLKIQDLKKKQNEINKGLRNNDNLVIKNKEIFLIICKKTIDGMYRQNLISDRLKYNGRS